MDSNYITQTKVGRKFPLKTQDKTAQPSSCFFIFHYTKNNTSIHREQEVWCSMDMATTQSGSIYEGTKILTKTVKFHSSCLC